MFIDKSDALADAEAIGASGSRIQLLPLIIRNLPNVLRLACLLSPDRGILHVDQDGNERRQTNVDLYDSARRVLAGLRAKGLRPGDPVVLQVDDSPAFLAAFWGAVLGGFVAVPLPIPGGFPVSEGMERITRVMGVLENACIVTDQPQGAYEGLGQTLTADVLELLDSAPARKTHRPRVNDTAILLFSSGSTGDPKGVMLTHKNILHALEAGSMAGSDVPAGDMRTVMLGYFFHVLKRKLFRRNTPGPYARSAAWLSRSAFGRFLARTRPGKYLMDTLLIQSGNRISVNLDLTWDDIIFANWMPYSHVVGLIALHVGPTMIGFEQVSVTARTFIEKPAFFLKLIDKYRVSYFGCSNFAVQWLTTQVPDEEIQGIDLSCVKAMSNVAEPVSPVVTRNFFDKFARFGFAPRAMCPAYGMSEATADITFPHLFEETRFHRVDRDALFKEKVIVPAASEEEGIEITELGAPVQGMHVRIVDDNDTLLKENRVGHVQIRGKAVVKGYYNNPSANQGLFSGSWLRTGDMGFMTGGRLVLTGRQKDIIFVHGQNLYANDIEEQIQRLPAMALKEFAVSGFNDQDSDTEKVALFVNTKEPREALSTLLSGINSHLVSRIGIQVDLLVPVNHIPRTPTSKIKRFKLRQGLEEKEFKEAVTAGEAANFVEAGQRDEGELTRTEKDLIEIFQEVTEQEGIGRHDNFFNLGGNSLKATKLVSRIREAFGVEVPVKAVFEHQSVMALAEAVSLLGEADTEKFPPIVPVVQKDACDLSHAQQRLWILDKMIPDSPFYNISGAVLLEHMELDETLLKAAFQKVVDRHDTLRTTFALQEDKPVQKIAKKLDVDVPIIDISGEADKEERLRQIIEQEKIIAFDLEKGPLYRATVIRLSASRHAFVIVMHHIISDGWSIGVLVKDAVSSYMAQLNNAALPDLPVQYKDFAVWQNTLLESPALKDQEAYWTQKLAGELPVLHLPVDHPRPPVQTQKGATRRTGLSRELTRGLRDLARAHGVTLFILTEALFKVLLQKLSGQEDIIIGAPIAGRNRREIEPLVGFFVNVLPVRSDLSGDPGFLEFLEREKATALEAIANQDYPFDGLVELLNPVRDLSRSPVFDVVYEFLEIILRPVCRNRCARDQDHGYHGR